MSDSQIEYEEGLGTTKSTRKKKIFIKNTLEWLKKESIRLTEINFVQK